MRKFRPAITGAAAALFLLGAGMIIMAFSNNQTARVVVGHATFTQFGQNAEDPNANTLSAPYAIYSDGTKLYIADTSNNRVLIYNTIPTSELTNDANVVVGQVDMQSNSANQGGSTAANTLSSPRGVFATASKLFIADQLNNRVLIFNSIPTANDAYADFVIGHTTMSASAFNDGGISGRTLKYPFGLYSDGTKLYIADSSNNRVLVFNSIPASNFATASFVIGQQTFVATNYAPACSALGVNNPAGVYISGGRLYLADQSNYRVKVYNPTPANQSAANAGATFVIGQADLGHCTQNSGPRTLKGPMSTFISGGNLYITDVPNSRVVVYSPTPADQTAAASGGVVYALGQADTATASNQFNRCNCTTSVAANTLYNPSGVWGTPSKLFVLDTNNNRALIFNSLPAANGVSADVAVGQADRNSGNANRSDGTTPSADSLNSPGYVFATAGKMFIADTNNSRVLIYPIPTSQPVPPNVVTADIVVGQPNMASHQFNRGLAAPTANTLYQPMGVYSDGTKLFIADTYNNRVLIFNSIPANQAAAEAGADVVVGQADKTKNCYNHGTMPVCGDGTPNSNTLGWPYTVYVSGGKLFISDTANNRVLIFNSVPAADNASADVVVCQSSMTNNGAGTTASTCNQPAAAAWIAGGGGKLFVADWQNNRVMIFPGALTTGMSATIAVGQPDLSHGDYNRFGVGTTNYNTLANPQGVFSDGTSLYIADTANNRILIYNPIPASQAAADAGANKEIGQGWDPGNLSYMTTNTPNYNGVTALSLSGPDSVFVGGSSLYIADTVNNRGLIYAPYNEHGKVMQFK